MLKIENNHCCFFFFFFFFFLSCFLLSCESHHKPYCYPSSCGALRNISYPFRLKTDPRNCGDRRYELACENNRTILDLYSGRYYVQAISYEKYTIRIIDPGLQSHNCSSLPLYSLTRRNFSRLDNPYALGLPMFYLIRMTYVHCPFQVVNSCYRNCGSCLNNGSYVVLGEMLASALKDSCSVGLQVVVSIDVDRLRDSTFSQACDFWNFSYYDVHGFMAKGIELTWYRVYCGKCSAGTLGCSVDENGNISCDDLICLLTGRRNIRCIWIWSMLQFAYYIIDNWKKLLRILGFIMLGRFSCGLLFLVTLLIYKFRQRHLALDEDIEEFLQDHHNRMPIRYSYSDIKRITQSFKSKLGQGGFGYVFKGTLRSGHLVAVKMLSSSKANGQEFINEVATIGRIHHINVVRLVGFCVEGKKRALLYEYMPNGSLEKYIFSHKENPISLSWEQMHDIAIGMARGIEYLHQGCDVKILHFDLKPSNILLDENFVPKISDFGLAKLCPVEDSIVTLTAVRGTIGYIAPELFYKNIGGVSHKSDVYSFGMLLMEMAGQRKNLNAHADRSSEIYFPLWVYNHFTQGEDIEMEGASEEEKKIAKKLAIVALWCIQMKPIDRPPMNKVLEMLERDINLLQIPPEPFLSPLKTTRSGNHTSSSNEIEILETSESESMSLLI